MPDPLRALGPVAAAVTAARLLLDRPAGLGGVRLGVVDGPSGSGKSTIAQLWAREVLLAGAPSVSVFSSDVLATWDEPFGWWSRFDTGVLSPLASGRSGRVQATDWSTGTPRPGAWLDTPPTSVLIVEGVSCGRREMGDRAGVLVWVELPDRRNRLERAVARDGEVSRRYLTAWQDDEDAFFAADRTRQRADVLVEPGTLHETR
jgi:uridine kinase